MTEILERIHEAKILIVDDNKDNVELLEELLALDRFGNVWSTTDPREVETLYREHRFDIILLDLHMPYLNGFQVMDRLSDILANDYLPILVLTAESDHEICVRALEMGAKDFITKPFHRAEVLLRICSMLEVRILYNQHRDQAKILEDAVKKRTRELRETQLEIIRHLGRAGEYRDNETGMHIVRMSKICECLAGARGLGDIFTETILHASPMHDVGKIGIPDRILLKPGKLDPKEWEIMQTHAEIGVKILGESPNEALTMARNIAWTHHEKFDGSGYPRGMVGEEIPVEGRIAAVADVFDALTSERPYKKAWSVEESVEFIKANSGSHFDPDYVELFVNSMGDILKIRKLYADLEGEVSDLSLHRNIALQTDTSISQLSQHKSAGG